MVDTVVVHVPPPVSVTVEVPAVRNTVTVDVGRKGDKGDYGESAYQAALDAGFVGTEAQWLASLRGAAGDAGTITSATAVGLAAGEAPSVTLGGTGSARTFEFGIPEGDKGDPGDVGPANSLAIGSVSEGTASATITGSAPAQTLNLTLPKGNKGDPGDSAYAVAVAGGFAGTEAQWLTSLEGTDGAAGAITDVTAVGLGAGVSPTVTLGGTDTARTIQLGIPAGATGGSGPANTLAIGTVAQGAAAATITGTAPSQTLNLTIPKGDTGDDGLTAYEVAVLDGFVGSEAAWLLSLKGTPGTDGASLLLIDGGTSADPYGGSVTIDGGTS